MAALFLFAALAAASVDLNVHLRFPPEDTQAMINKIHEITASLGINNAINFEENIPHITLYLSTFTDDVLDSVNRRSPRTASHAASHRP